MLAYINIPKTTRNRGYYMAARRYEISFGVLKNSSLVFKSFHERHREARFSYVTIATVIFSRVKISCFRAKAHLVFHWCLYNKYSFEPKKGIRLSFICLEASLYFRPRCGDLCLLRKTLFYVCEHRGLLFVKTF